MPFAYTVRGLCVYTSTSQPGSNSLTVKLRKNGGYLSPDPTVSIPGGGGSGTWCDNTDQPTGSANDWLDLELKNNNGAVRAEYRQSTLGLLRQQVRLQEMLIFGMGAIGAISTAPTDMYFAPFGGSRRDNHAGKCGSGCASGITVKNLHCWVVACPSTSAHSRCSKMASFPREA